MIAGSRQGRFGLTLGLMLAAYALFSGSQFLQDFISAHLSQRIVRVLRQELFAKLMDMPVKYLDDNSHGDVMSRMREGRGRDASSFGYCRICYEICCKETG